MDAGATAWVLASTALVLLMTPGVAFFYGGMVRGNNVLGILMQGFVTVALVTVVWVVVGFSLAFSKGNGLIGGFDFAGLINASGPLGTADKIPIEAFAAFQLMFAVITPALITGATAERWRFASFVPFVIAWALLVYSPVAHWGFSPFGWAVRWGALDFAGGGVVHANAGAAALAMALLLGRRKGWPERAARPHNLTLVMIGTAMLWFGWLGFNGGSALAADRLAGIATLNTQLAASAGLLAWICTERLRFGKPTTLGAASGVVAGLVAVTPAAGYVNSVGALAAGLLAGALCQLAAGLKTWFGLDDSLDVAAVHLVGGVIGSLSVGLFATRSVNPAGANGLFYGGGYALLGKQAVSVFAVVAYSLLATLLIGLVIDRVVGNRVTPRDESTGLDLSQHGEAAYEATSPSRTTVPEATESPRPPAAEPTPAPASLASGWPQYR
jgi:Amt family ammonium transporter